MPASESVIPKGADLAQNDWVAEFSFTLFLRGLFLLGSANQRWDVTTVDSLLICKRS
jgi:hypothetical protein